MTDSTVSGPQNSGPQRSGAGTDAPSSGPRSSGTGTGTPRSGQYGPGAAGGKLSLRGVRKAFGATTVLDGIDLDVQPGEVITLIGASGSGKSTLLRCINLLEPIDDGEIHFDGLDIAEPGLDPDPIRRRIGMVFQSFNLFPHMSVTRNVAIGPIKVLGADRATAYAAARVMLDKLGLADRADAYPDQLSGGQQQRVAIARSLAMDPEVMLLDEITSALDPELVGEVLDVVRGLKADGMTMLFATHEMTFAREISDRVCFLHHGRILEAGPPDQLFGSPQEERTKEFLQRVTDAGRL
jgi:polar amino acid transport system ATP-binding protein